MADHKELYLNKVFPDASILKITCNPYDKIKDDCIFVLDANALLSP